MDSGTFDNGARTGRWIGWYPNGQKRSEGEYVANRRVGEWTEWYPNGQVESTGKYYRGLPSGIHKTYHSNGALARELENFAPGIGTAKTYDRDGTLRGEEQIVNDTVRVGKYFRDDEEFADMSQAYVRPFPVGMEDKDDLFEYLDENLKYPEISRRAGHGGEVAITLHIDEDGNLVDAYVSHSATPALDEAALNVARTLTKWRPARIGNRESYYVFTLPIGFKLVD
jgi:TonB family protein